MTISYKKLKRYLTQELGYTDEEAARSIDGLRNADSEVQRAFAQFWSTGEEPSNVGGVNVGDLKRLRQLDLVAALLAVEMLAITDDNLAEKLNSARRAAAEKVLRADAEVARKLRERKEA